MRPVNMQTFTGLLYLSSLVEDGRTIASDCAFAFMASLGMHQELCAFMLGWLAFMDQEDNGDIKGHDD